MANQIEEEEPLDPVMEKVRVKMVRLLGISIGLMLLALITVLGAVVYKISQGSEGKEAKNDNSTALTQSSAQTSLLENIDVDLPEGASVLSSALADNRLMIDVRLKNGQRQFWIIDLTTGATSRVTTK